MTLRYAINQEVFTNSLLIYPHFDEADIFQFYWQRRESFFFGDSQQRINQLSSDLSFQCSVLDYRSMIQLVVMDKKNRKSIFSYGPTKLQPQLLFHIKNQNPKYNIQISFNKKEKMPATLKFRRKQNYIETLIQIKNGLRMNLNYEIEHSIENIFSHEGVQNNEILLNFLEKREEVVKILKYLKVYSLNGNYFKIVFETQLKRDLFLLQFLLNFGYQFKQLKEQKFQPWKIKQKTHTHRRTSPTFKNAQITGFFPQQKEPLSPITPSDTLLHHMLFKQSFRSSGFEKINSQFLKDHNLSESIYWSDEEADKNCSTKQFDQLKSISSKFSNEKSQNMEKRKERHNQTKEGPPNPEYQMVMQRLNKIEEQNKYLRDQNQELKKLVKQMKTHQSPKKQIPEFIKIMHINRAIQKNMTTHFQNSDEKEDDKKLNILSPSQRTLTFGQNSMRYPRNVHSPHNSEKSELSTSFGRGKKGRQKILKAQITGRKNSNSFSLSGKMKK